MNNVKSSFSHIKKTWNLISNKLEKELNVVYTQEETIEIYYTLLLVSYGIRHGTYIEGNIESKYVEKTKRIYDFENKKFCDLIYRIFSKIKTIDNLDIYVGAIYDNSTNRDTIYIYNKNNPFIGNIKKLENIKRTGINTPISNIHRYIAELLGYDVVKYKHFYDDENALTVRYNIQDVDTGKFYNILSYISYKNRLVKNYEKLKNMNKILKQLGSTCYLTIIDTAL